MILTQSEDRRSVDFHARTSKCCSTPRRVSSTDRGCRRRGASRESAPSTNPLQYMTRRPTPDSLGQQNVPRKHLQNTLLDLQQGRDLHILGIDVSHGLPRRAWLATPFQFCPPPCSPIPFVFSLYRPDRSSPEHTTRGYVFGRRKSTNSAFCSCADAPGGADAMNCPKREVKQLREVMEHCTSCEKKYGPPKR